MPRKQRIILPCCPHHIIQRSHNRQIIKNINKNETTKPEYQIIKENRSEFETILDIDPIFMNFGETRKESIENYKKFIGDDAGFEEVKFIRDSIKSGYLTGNSLFEEAVKKIIKIRVERRKQGRPFKKK